MTIEKIVKACGYETAANIEKVVTPGTFVLANVATTAKPQEWMPDYSVGGVLPQKTALVEAREHLAPTAKIITPGKEFAYAFHDRAESFKTVDYDKLVRGLGGEFGYFDSQAEKHVGQLENIGISVVVEKHLAKLDPAMEARLVAQAENILEYATLMQAYSKILAIADAFEWNSAGADNPDKILKNAMLDAGDEAGFSPNRILYGQRAWVARDSWFDAQQTAGGFRAPRTAADFGAILDADVLIPTARGSNAGLFPAVGTNTIIGSIGFAGTPVGDISNVKTFVGPEGTKRTEWDHPQGELKVITVSRWQTVKTTSTLGAFAITVA